MDSVLFVITVDNASSLDEKLDTRRLSGKAALTYRSWIEEYVTDIFFGVDYPSVRMSALLSVGGKEAVISPLLTASWLEAANADAAQTLLQWMADLQPGTLLVAHHSLIRLLGGEPVQADCLYCIRLKRGQIRKITAVRQESDRNELLRLLQESGGFTTQRG